MRNPNDYGLSPNIRYSVSKIPNGKIVNSAAMIRMFADYNKVRPVQNCIIKIQLKEIFLFFEITDSEWAHILNGDFVRVRMAKDETSFIYLFDYKTDTYMTFVERKVDTIGEQANMTPQSRKAIHQHSQTLKKHEEYRQEKLRNETEVLGQEKSNFPELPESFRLPALVTKTSNKENEEKEEAEGTTSKPKSKEPETKPRTKAPIHKMETITHKKSKKEPSVLETI